MSVGAIKPKVRVVLTAVNDAVVLDVLGAQVAIFTFPAAAALTGGGVVFEANYNGTWVALSAPNVAAPATAVTTLTGLAAAPLTAHLAVVRGAQQVRCRMSARTTGTLTCDGVLAD